MAISNLHVYGITLIFHIPYSHRLRLLAMDAGKAILMDMFLQTLNVYTQYVLGN